MGRETLLPSQPWREAGYPMVNRTIKARDLCASCYHRLWTKGALPPKVTAADQVLDALAADGGWLTTDAVCHALPVLSYSAVHKALFRLRDDGHVESRPGISNVGFPPNEWRVV